MRYTLDLSLSAHEDADALEDQLDAQITDEDESDVSELKSLYYREME
jgi:hypothetical protein